MPVSEIKTGCKIFEGVHPEVCTFFEPFITAIYWEGA